MMFLQFFKSGGCCLPFCTPRRKGSDSLWGDSDLEREKEGDVVIKNEIAEDVKPEPAPAKHFTPPITYQSLESNALDNKMKSALRFMLDEEREMKENEIIKREVVVIDNAEHCVGIEALSYRKRRQGTFSGI